MTKSIAFIRTCAWPVMLTIIVLSVVPGSMRPHVMADDRYEHVVAYFIAGSLLAVRYSRPSQLILNGVVLVSCAAALEIVQLWIPDRTSSVYDFAASAFGACVALVLVGALRWARDSMAAVSLAEIDRYGSGLDR